MMRIKAESDIRSLKVAVISDAHVLAPELYGDNEAFRGIRNCGTTLMEHSTKALELALDQVEKAQTELLLICGDLSQDGEMQSHLYVRDQLEKLKKKMPQLKILVIDGNHDINNPAAYDFRSGSGEPTTRVSPEAFREIWRAYGYDDACAAFGEQGEEGCLSYAVRVVDGFTVIAVDTVKYQAYHLAGKAGCLTEGYMPPKLIQWVTDQARFARERGDFPLIMQHHGIAEHHRGMSNILRVSNYRAVEEAYARAQIRCVLSGHGHAMDTAHTQTGAVVDIETGSLIGYPYLMRIGTLRINQTVDATLRLKACSLGAEAPNILQRTRNHPLGIEDNAVSVLYFWYILPWMNATANRLPKLFGPVGVSLSILWDDPKRKSSFQKELCHFLKDYALIAPIDAENHNLLSLYNCANEVFLGGHGIKESWAGKAIETFPSWFGEFARSLVTGDLLENYFGESLAGIEVNKLDPAGVDTLVQEVCDTVFRFLSQQSVDETMDDDLTCEVRL